MYPNSFYKMKNFANPKTMFKSCINNDEEFSTEPVLPTTNSNRIIRSSSLRAITKSGSPIGPANRQVGGYPSATSTPDRHGCGANYATARSSQAYGNAPSGSGNSNNKNNNTNNNVNGNFGYNSGNAGNGFGFVGSAGNAGGSAAAAVKGAAATAATERSGRSSTRLSKSRSRSSGSNTDDTLAAASVGNWDNNLPDSNGGDLVNEQQQPQQLQQQEPAEPHHPLHSNWTLWYLENDRSKSWEDMLHEVTSFNTVENFWSLINHIKPPSEIKVGSDYCLFKKGIRPMWEDDANVHGGRWVINLNKNTQNDLDNFWLDTMLCLIGECCDYSDELCGAVVNIRGKSNKISIWTADGGNEAAALEIGNKLRESLRMESGYVLQYQLHKDTMVKQGSTVKSIYTL